MKKNKFFITIAISAVIMTVVSCKKTFLDENLTTARSLEFYKTDAGIVSLVNGTYHHVFCQPFNGEFAFAYMAYGTQTYHILLMVMDWLLLFQLLMAILLLPTHSGIIYISE